MGCFRSVSLPCVHSQSGRLFVQSPCLVFIPSPTCFPFNLPALFSFLVRQAFRSISMPCVHSQSGRLQVFVVQLSKSNVVFDSMVSFVVSC